MTHYKENMAILGLLCTALFLGLALSLVTTDNTSNVAVAGSMQESGGDYVITIARLSEGQEAAWVLDARNRTIGVYQYVTGSRRIELQKRLTLDELQSPGR